MAILSGASCAHGRKALPDEAAPAPAAEAAAPEPCVSPIDSQIRKGLSEVGDKVPRRSGLIDIVLPADATQLRALNAMAVLNVTLFSHDPAQLPGGEVRVVRPGQVLRLPRIFPRDHVEVLPEADAVARKFGRYRHEFFLFIPIRSLSEEGDLVVEFKQAPRTLKLARFPVPLNQPYLEGPVDLREDPSRLPDPALVIALLKKHYCLGK